MNGMEAVITAWSRVPDSRTDAQLSSFSVMCSIAPMVAAMAEPRTLEQRIADTAARLENDIDCWLATAGADGPGLVPLSFVCRDGEMLLATDAASLTCRNIVADPSVRIGVGPTRDVVMIDGEARLAPATEMTEDELAAYVAKCGSDPRGWADTLVRVKPSRVHAWREENELRGRLLMREGRWLEG